MELKRCFGIDLLLSKETAEEIWERANEKLSESNFSACGMLKQFKVKALCTTDDPAEGLIHHKTIKNDSLACKVYPTFRPDQSWGIDHANNFIKWVKKLEKTSGLEISNLDEFLNSLSKRLEDFHQLGSRLSDHSFPYFFANFPTELEACDLFDQTMNGKKCITS